MVKGRLMVMGAKKKQALFDRYFALLEEWRSIDDEMMRLVEAGVLTSGHLLVHGRYNNWGARKIDAAFSGPKDYFWQNITGWDLQYAIKQIEDGLVEDKAIVNNALAKETN